jgi:dolichyl-phosphate beta-glucosyltransferase
MPQPLLSVVIPAYNEAERLPRTLLAIDAYLSGRDYTYEIIVADDGSKDATSDIVERMRKTVKHLKLLRFEANRGKGAVVRDGMLSAEGKYRVFTDADNSTSIDQFENMRPLFEEGAGVVIGSRAHKESRLDPAEPWYRQVPGKMGNLFIQLLVLPGLWDTQCGFKGFTAEAAERVFRLTRIAGWGFDIEALAVAKRLGYGIKEIPVHWINDTASHVKASAYLKVLIETVKIRLWLWTGKYNARPDEQMAT